MPAKEYGWPFIEDNVGSQSTTVPIAYCAVSMWVDNGIVLCDNGSASSIGVAVVGPGAVLFDELCHLSLLLMLCHPSK
jgi:hypothetical protein